MIIDVKQKAIKAEYQIYVKPTIDTQLTPYCTDLTGITQEKVDEGTSITDALKLVHLFLGNQGLFGTEFVFMSNGEFYGNQLTKEARTKNFFVPSYFKRWINLKKAFPLHKFNSDAPVYDFNNSTTINKCKA